MNTKINEVDRIEITTLEDNYIDVVAGGDSSIIKRATGFRAGKRMSILAEHGFSAFIQLFEGNRTRTLQFDFGNSKDVAARNADSLGIDLGLVEAAALSHGHSDHRGGISDVAAKIGKKDLEIVMHPVAFRQNRYAYNKQGQKGPQSQIMSKTELENVGFKITETREPYMVLGGDVLFLGEIPRKTFFEKGMPNTYYEDKGQEIRDNIEDDTSIVMNMKGKGLIILSGCAHSGIVNTVEYAREVTGIKKVHVVMGGFHLTGADFEPIISDTVNYFKEVKPDYIVPTHCTGRKAIAAFESTFPGRFILNMSGTKLTFTA
jgi:7,8-dihydropterin-6-yl-methyl-4-(beta-D-ribofuranosyl)aminobenzene 5'-phosphate synthase